MLYVPQSSEQSVKVLPSPPPHQHLKELCVFVERDHPSVGTRYLSVLPDLLFVGVAHT